MPIMSLFHVYIGTAVISMGLRFTTTCNIDTIAFLDLNLKIVENHVYTSTFHKEPAGNTILHADSCHPKHVIRNIPNGEIIRARRNCSKLADFREESHSINRRLQCKGYPAWTLKRAVNIAEKKDRDSLLSDRTVSRRDGVKNRPLVFSMAYSIDMSRFVNLSKSICLSSV